MRHLILALVLLLPFLSFAQEEIQYKEYSYTELFQMIEDEEDSVFELRNAIISYDPATDSAFMIEATRTGEFIPNLNIPIEVKKELILRNIFFPFSTANRLIPGLANVTFHKPVRFDATPSLFISNCIFHDEFTFTNLLNFSPVYDKFENYRGPRALVLGGNFFNGSVQINSYSNQKVISYVFQRNHWKNAKAKHFFTLNGRSDIIIKNNKLEGESISFQILNAPEVSIARNEFRFQQINFNIDTELSPKFDFSENSFSGALFLSTKSLSPETATIDWNQFETELYEFKSFDIFKEAIINSEDHPLKDSILFNSSYKASFKNNLNKGIITESAVFKNEVNNLGKFYRYYKERHDNEFANSVYVRLKNLETERYAYLYSEDRNFKRFFTWKINQFLKVFSSYGTEPAKAIIFSLYVILAFAIVYLFFPNHWDSHGKNRIVDRFSFFLKYMKKDAGMHDVYLEEKQGDILAYDEYKQLLESSGKDVPKFFQATGLPLYKWAISGTKLTAGFLSRVDVMKGTWSELPQSKRIWKSTLLVSAFLIALFYDIFIKMLNALMLSINTFTTLGFGEIPIKGLPRYLAIIQGFIGWFMLTIFSVSLISQLLN